MTVLEVIQRSAEFLQQKGVDSPRLQIELMLAHILKMPRLQLYLNFQRELTEVEVQGIRELVRRRGQREPLQHITGSTSFCGFEIKCSRAALVPRPETELLAERAWQFLSSLAESSPAALEIGTGTGCIAIAIASKAPSARVVAADLSPEALELAAHNAAQNNVSDRIEFRAGDAFVTWKLGSPFDLIVSNPPYIPTGEIESLQPEVRDFDPRLALDGGADGMNFYRRLADEAKAHLKPGGKMMLEFGDDQHGVLKTLFEDQKWIVEEIVEDYSSRPRILIVRAT